MSIGLNLKLIYDLAKYSQENGLDLVTAAETLTLYSELQVLQLAKMMEMEEEIKSLKERLNE